MRDISRQRWLVENEGRKHAVVRGCVGWLRLHFENMYRLQKLVEWCHTAFGLKQVGLRNALDVCVEEVTLECAGLGEAFDGVRIAFLSDLHIDGVEGLCEKVIEVMAGVEYDYCVLGGDYSFGFSAKCEDAQELMRRLCSRLAERSRVFGVLGNHDKYRMGEVLEGCSVEMLVNDNAKIEREDEAMYFVGVDDCHYFGAEDVETAEEGIEEGAFKLMVCHSPEYYRQAASRGYRAYLAGHTHGGQVCLPGGGMIVRGATAPRRFLKGKWELDGMAGYTSRGVGVSGIAVRHFCRPEIAVITLRNSSTGLV